MVNPSRLYWDFTTLEQKGFSPRTVKAFIAHWFPFLDLGGLPSNFTHNTNCNEKINSKNEKPQQRQRPTPQSQNRTRKQLHSSLRDEKHPKREKKK
jgi:hypothetical protein